jgi:3-methyladenine DNA glycosylase AlkC
MTALKDLYTTKFFETFLTQATAIVPTIDKKKFIQEIYTKDWLNKELKQRTRHTTEVLHQFMPKEFKEASKKIVLISKKLREEKVSDFIYGYIFLADYIEVYGLNHLKESIDAMEEVTQFISCEFAVRPFILKYPNEMKHQMLLWSKHPNQHVRRLSSEGSRPRLPWAMGIPDYKKNPQQNIPVLENLKNDPSDYVRRSVANHLNDIAKDQPEVVIDIAQQWMGTSKETDALVKHACRTLLKQGQPSILKLFGLDNNQKVEVTHFKILTPKVKIGGELLFEFDIENKSTKEVLLRIEFAIYYLRQNGTHSKKVFKHSERTLLSKEKLCVVKKQSFRIITTRVFYTGVQKVSLIINGHERESGAFELKG